jgi:hypothetical protein
MSRIKFVTRKTGRIDLLVFLGENFFLFLDIKKLVMTSEINNKIKLKPTTLR